MLNHTVKMLVTRILRNQVVRPGDLVDVNAHESETLTRTGQAEPVERETAAAVPELAEADNVLVKQRAVRYRKQRGARP